MRKAADGLGDPWHHIDCCDSTNDELARLAAAGATHGTVVVAASQRAGRGRQGREWISREIGNLYGSILLRPPLAAQQVSPLSLVAGIAVARAVRARGVRARLKWPNDIVVGSLKLGGILAEASSRSGALDHVIIGIGVNMRAAPEVLGNQATSLEGQGAAAAAPTDLMRAILDELGPRLEAFVGGGLATVRSEFLALWRDRDRPARAEVGKRIVRGTAVDVDDSGALIILDEHSVRTAVVAGDVQIDYA